MDLNKCKELIEKNYSYTDIAKEFNMAITTVRRKLKQAGLKTKYNPFARVNLDINVVKKLVNEHHSTHDIAKKLNTSQTNVRYWLKKWKLKTKSKYSGYKNPVQRKLAANNYHNYQKKRGLDRKIMFINQLGGKCSICGYNKNYGSLTFHHLNPNEKEFTLDMRKMSNNSFVKLQKEVSKCQLLCHNCHMELHYPHLEIGGPCRT